MSRLLILAVSLLFTLTACAPPPQLLWHKPGAAQADFARDRYACIQDSRVTWSAGGSGGLGLALMLGAEMDAQRQSNRLFLLCMEARGYTYTVQTHE